jgi:non-specific serine/threonine protein kinase
LIIESQPLTRLSSRLPRFLTDLVGRAREIDILVDLLANPAVRLVTITGPGGVGKTRVAVAAGTRLQEEREASIAWIQLSTLDDHSRLEQAIVDALGLPDRPMADPAETLRAAIGDESVCLILDNFEQIIEAAPRIVDLLLGCPNLQILVTSRERLRVRGEREMPLEPLSTPETVEQAVESPAVHLFMDRARDVVPDFQLTDRNAGAIVGICHRLDGLPLALELAAARLRHMSVTALADLLRTQVHVLASEARDIPERQQTLAATIDWSYRLLTDDEQAVFRRLSVFRGGFSLEAAEGILKDLPGMSQDVQIIDCLSSLVEKNLVRQIVDHEGLQGPRFLLLWAIREFADHELERHGECASARSRHAAWYLNALASLWDLPNIGWIPGDVLDRVEPNHQNLRRAMTWFEETGDRQSLMILVATLAPFWLQRSHRNEGLSAIARVLEQVPADAVLDEARAAACYGAALLARSHGDLAKAERYARESITLYEQSGDDLGTGAAKLALGIIQRTSGDLEAARTSLERAVAILGNNDSGLWRYVAWRDLGMLYVWQGRTDLAEPFLARALKGFQSADNAWGISVTTMAIARSLAIAGRSDEARRQLASCLDISSERGTPEILIDVLADTGMLEHDATNRVPALQLMLAVQRECERQGYRFEQPERNRFEDCLARLRAAATADELRAATDRSHLDVDRMLDLSKRILTPESPAPEAAPPHGTSGFPGLTTRELEVLQLVAKGLSDREIGDALSISHRTVMRHVANLLPKLGVNSRTAAAALWHRHEVHTPPA